MKITKARLKEIIMEELQREGKDRGEGAMADSQLNRIADLATMIDEMVDDDTKLPNWVKSKITKTLDYMSTVMNYMKGEMADAEEEMKRSKDLKKRMGEDPSPLEKFLMIQSAGKSLTDLDEDILEEGWPDLI